MKIEILGTGCARCDKLEALTRAAAGKLDFRCEVTHVRDMDAMVRHGVVVAPALAIDGKIVLSGCVPTEVELISLLTSAAG